MDLVRAIRHQPSGLKAFYIQYLSLILIVLTVVAGTMTRRHFRAEVQDSDPSPAIENSVNAISAWSEFHELPPGLHETSRLGLLAAWQEVLKEHDVTLEIELQVTTLQEGLELSENFKSKLSMDATSAEELRFTLDIDAKSSGLKMRERWRRIERLTGEGT